MSFDTPIHRTHISQHILQVRVFDVMGDQFISRPQELFRMSEQIILPTAKPEHIHLISQIIQSIDISADCRCLMGELLTEVGDKCLASFWNTVGLPWSQISNAVHAV